MQVALRRLVDQETAAVRKLEELLNREDAALVGLERRLEEREWGDHMAA